MVRRISDWSHPAHSLPDRPTHSTLHPAAVGAAVGFGRSPHRFGSSGDLPRGLPVRAILLPVTDEAAAAFGWKAFVDCLY